jgi:uncharacterized protein YaiE (UPF0345 family)
MFKVNEYFDGKVKSLAFQTEKLPATIGVMAPGNYTFNTQDKEKVSVVSGAMTITLPDTDQAETFIAGNSFEVPANSSFEVQIDTDTAYLCLYG